MEWTTLGEVPSKSYECSYCGNRVASVKGWNSLVVDLRMAYPGGAIYVCPHCTNPTYFTRKGQQIPGAPFGAAVSGIDEAGIQELYNESRRAYSASCYTAVVLGCRKLLMHVAVSKGAAEGLPFIKYVDFLDSKHFVPTGARGWIDKIREKGNEANHEIVIMSQSEAEEMILFCEMLLKILYEFPAKIK